MRAFILLTCSVCVAQPAVGQIVQRNAQYRLPAQYNDAFYATHQAAARSFYAAHFAHFGVYEQAWSAGADDLPGRMADLESEVRRLVDAPPRWEPPVDVVAPNWTRLAYQTAQAMDWTHDLHSQLYDILSDDRVRDKRAAGERAIAYYLSKRSAAFSTRGYGHAFMMGGGTWAGTFAERFPTLNGILWAYHWHHAAVYEALMEPDSVRRRQELERVIRVFEDSVLANPPTYMPLTAEVAPRFGAMFPAAAHIFDNLHMMHDVVNDIMVDGTVPPSRKGAEIDRLLSQMLYRNQDWIIPPAVDSTAHGSMSTSAMRVPTRLPNGSWLPQGHPDARVAGAADHVHEPGGGR